ncbi:hypothetical protein HN51_021778 [Arachis hypogaea]|uniref:Uncharacterized protein n=3 Tax=Arachis TaxID=3817 RepID=A0A445EGI3_ARAHY|nr:uncharacterized protein LOC107473806 [Arachis duranensis]QHO52873.1 uncharacterized protein DS421_2g42960 [Arachis hypogaea]RYR74526.1 hypothetical protein Ahy_A02g009264 [Arachis hypogaea]
MNTKTMRLPPRRVLTPSGPKRKEREDPFERPKPITTTTSSKLLKPDRPTPRPVLEPITTTTPTAATTSPSTSSPSSVKGFESTTPSNQLLAGCLAHEYLTKGTLLGQPWAQVWPESPIVAEKEDCSEKGGAATTTATTASKVCRETEEQRERYAKVASLFKCDGVHLSGVVNPAQLARYLHL